MYCNEDNPYQTPTSLGVKQGDDPLRRVISCAVIGAACGLFWTAVFGPFTAGPPSLMLSALVYTSGFALTGVAVGLAKSSALFVGPLSGMLILSAWAIIVGPRDGWLLLWLVIFGGSGLIWGFVIGGLGMLVIRRHAT